ncbi:hypothetical protein OC861_001579 [Tilletia horrida]|nr:hypothetical protein OC861_001579 [Tilletia horrida]
MATAVAAVNGFRSSKRGLLCLKNSRLAHVQRAPAVTEAGSETAAPRAVSRTKKKVVEGRTRYAKLVEDLPLSKLETTGQRADPLPPWNTDVAQTLPKTSKRTGRKAKLAENPESEHVASQDQEGAKPLSEQLSADGQPWPPLAQEVLNNLARFPGCFLLTRVGGFYESYFSQAPELASLLSIKLASRFWGGRTVPMAGFPLSQLEKYLKVLVQDSGKLVAICEEFRELPQNDTAGDDCIPKAFNEGVTIRRRVTRVVTPGTLIDEKFLDPFSNNFILSVSRLLPTEPNDPTSPHPAQPVYGLAWLDVSTADFNTTTCVDAVSLRDEVARISPREVILQSNVFGNRTKALTSTGSEPSQHTGSRHPLWDVLDPKSVLITYTPDQPDPVQQKSAITPPPFRFEGPEITQAEHAAVAYLTRYLQDRLLDIAASAITESTPLHRDQSKVMHIDAHTMAALEIKETSREGGVRGSLTSIVRRTLTRGGTRLLGEWLTSPSTDIQVIQARQRLVELFLHNSFLREDLRLHLRRGAGDVSRVLQKIVTARNDEQDLLEVRDFIGTCNVIANALKAEVVAQDSSIQSVDETSSSHGRTGLDALKKMAESFHDLNALGAQLADAIDASVMEKRIRAQEEMARRLEQEVAEQTGIYSQSGHETHGKATSRKSKAAEQTKAGVDGIWGPPLEHLIRPSSSSALQALTKEHNSLRRQAGNLQSSLQNVFSDRVSLKFLLGQGFVVHFPEFKDRYSEHIDKEMTPAQRNRTTRTFYHPQWTTIGNRLHRLVDQLREKEAVELERLRQSVMLSLSALRHNARLVDQLDVLLGFSQLAQDHDLVRPIIDESRDIEVRDGRHLSVEVGLLESQASLLANEEAQALIGPGGGVSPGTNQRPNLQQRSFVANDLVMHAESDSMLLITGPNMGGKSTFLRQNAIMAILAQCGSFVPARYARVGIVDRVFSRVGAKDDLFRDRSTFMVEMLETAEILGRVTSKSLVIADEIGRGTTSDVGLAVAYTTVHQLHARGCRTLFASHFHEVADMLGYDEAVDGLDGKGRGPDDRFPRVRFFCTDVEETPDGSIFYSHRLKAGVNRDSHGLKVVRIAGMPASAVHVAEAALRWIQGPSGWARTDAMRDMRSRLDLLDSETEAKP